MPSGYPAAMDDHKRGGHLPGARRDDAGRGADPDDALLRQYGITLFDDAEKRVVPLREIPAEEAWKYAAGIKAKDMDTLTAYLADLRVTVSDKIGALSSYLNAAQRRPELKERFGPAACASALETLCDESLPSEAEREALQGLRRSLRTVQKMLLKQERFSMRHYMMREAIGMYFRPAAD